ncbi:MULTISPECIES: peptidase domain-containing ABC transporter [Photorhabdus]|uniref:ATP-binding cassette domain-containing protein n=1 Tax=Photorhabdus kayaii TaxID=230088 RepID=A0ABX0AWY3_9GAMM|nr:MULTISPECIES: peptidase domain-containing ABC transporter [Photorhabdus]MCT8352776.1 peptidase domain-containing ABC transporter [Photorhabdus kayaii]NDL11672.1 ATP-binding cassette domain-containing protein [Photorhabdus kayaii]NDL25306.1 ATP-binding cassette domain-containing protein [Photorhabdus kayaii]RAX10447.1 colicin V synthesis protein [Photorhabdus sp. HUG-39]
MKDNNSLFDFIPDLFFRKKINIIYQESIADCGLACISMILCYYGCDTTLKELKGNNNFHSRGLRLKDLLEISENNKLNTNVYSLDVDEINLLKKPCILHWDMNHFVILEKVNKNKFFILDPEKGERILSINEISKHFTGVAIELTPTPEFKKRSSFNKKTIKLIDLFKSSKGLSSALLKIFAISILIESITLTIPIGIQLIMDHVIVTKDTLLLSSICIFLIFFTLVKTFSDIIRSYMSLSINILLDIQWKNSLFSHLLRIPIHYFSSRKLGDIQSRFNSIENIRETFCNNIVDLIIDFLMIIGLLSMMIIYGGSLTIVVILFSVLYFLVKIIVYKIYKNASDKKIQDEATINSFFMESLYSMPTIKILGILNNRQRIYSDKVKTLNKSEVKKKKIEIITIALSSIIIALDQIVILWVGSYLVINSTITIGMFIAFNTYRGQFSDRITNIINKSVELKLLSLHNERLSGIALQEKEIFKKNINSESYDIASLELSHVSYTYNESNYTISDFSIKIEGGESVAIVGPSGAGKSTLIKIMSGLIKPQSGEVLFNNLDIYSLGVNNYRKNISCILQEDKLFSGTIAENISGFDDDIDMEYVTECAIKANIHNEIVSFPMGYYTQLSELGGSISGGQKQRIMIARALYKKPKIIFMDEATSHLDTNNESIVNKSIANLNVTRIIVAHRESTIQSADRVIHLNSEPK